MAQALREAFLGRAACFTVTSSPSTSAFLMAERLDSLAASYIAISPAVRAMCCSACGCLFVPGWTASQARESFTSGRHADERVRELVRQASHKNMVHECRSCHRKTVITVQKPAELKKPTKANHNKLATAQPSSEGPISAKSTAKQRAKDRKSKQSLQALLMSSKSKQKTAASTPSPLNLMDFMKE